MVTTFNRKDLISFGKFLLSEERRESYKHHPELGEKNLEERLSEVNHADVENWIESQTKYRFSVGDRIFAPDEKGNLTERVYQCFICNSELAVFAPHQYSPDGDPSMSFNDMIVVSNDPRLKDSFNFEFVS